MKELKTIREMINEMAAGRAGATLMSDDQGKLYELSLAKAINNHPDVGRGDKLPRHHRSHSDNPEHAGTPGQVYDRLVKKGGKNSSEVALIKKQAKEIAPKIIDSFKESGHLGKTETNGVKHPPTKVTNVFWTSNRDTEKKSGDHQLTSGIRDPKSKGDVMLTIAPQHPAGHYKENHKAYKNGHDQGVIALVEKRRAEEKGEKYTLPENPHPKGSKAHKVWSEGFGHGQLATHVNISAKYASKPITFENAGIESIGRKLGSKDLVKKLKDESDAHDERMAKQFGYSGKTHGEIHEKKFKPDRTVYEKELHDHMKKTGTKVGFKPKSKEAKKVHAAYAAANESYKTAIGHVRKHMLNMNHKQLKNFILDSTSPETHHETLVAHSNPVTGENQVHSRSTYDNFINEHKNLRVEAKDTESGPTVQIVGDHPVYGKGVTVAQMGHRISHGITGARTFDFKMPSFGKKRQVKKEKLNEMLLERSNKEKIMAAAQRASAVFNTTQKSKQIQQTRVSADNTAKGESETRKAVSANRAALAAKRQAQNPETTMTWRDDEGYARGYAGAQSAAAMSKMVNLSGVNQFKMEEEAPANAMGTAGISGLDTAVDVGIAGRDMLLTPGVLRRPPPKMFGGKRVFTVPSKDYYKATLGRKKGQHWRSMVNGPLGEEIRQYALDNKDAPIIVEDETTGAMMYLRYGKR